jgi:hypothetical protein
MVRTSGMYKCVNCADPPVADFGGREWDSCDGVNDPYTKAARNTRAVRTESGYLRHFRGVLVLPDTCGL